MMATFGEHNSHVRQLEIPHRISKIFLRKLVAVSAILSAEVHLPFKWLLHM